MPTATTLRHRGQMDFFNPEDFKNKKIVIVGVGGVGSLTALVLAQLGLQDITIIDFDEIENHNVSSQFYQPSQLGVSKVEALASNIFDYTGVPIKEINDKYKPEYTKNADIVIMGVDDMDVRKDIVETSNPKLSFIDVRMAAEIFEVYTFSQYEKDTYMKDWYSNEEASKTMCTNKSVSYNTAVIAGIVGKLTKDILTNKETQYNYAVDLVNMVIG